ncbi:hypothetical protein IJX73_00085 [bacterium]|nr:hypothetical protein [bacterium]MBQ9149308.1 hypothetical protein [bacterium]
MYKTNYKIRYSELDCNLSLKPASLLQLLQDSASENAENLGFGYSFLAKNNLGWFLLKYHIEFYDYPKDACTLTIATEPRGYNKIFAFRDFAIFQKEKIAAKATTTWSLVDLKEKSMTNIADVLIDNPYMKQFEKKEDDLKYCKISQLNKIDIEKTFDIRFDDLDVNQHVNNSNFLVWALESLDYNFRKTKQLKALDIIFKKEIKYGNKICSQVELIDNTTKHILKNSETNEELALIQIEWK